MKDEDGQKVLEEFALRIKEVVKENNITMIYNADQTAVNYEYVPKTTIDKVGKKTIWIKAAGQDKARATAMLLADSSGTKHPLFIVLKTQASKIHDVVEDNLQSRNGFGRIVWKEIEDLHSCHPSRIYGNPTAWWNSRISMEFLTYHFGDRRGENVPKFLLLWDAFSAHFTSEVVDLAKELNIILEKVPPRYTWICQPADVCWMKPFKSHLRRLWLEFVLNQIENNKNTESFKLKPPSRFDIVDWINHAWSCVATKIIINGFVKCKLIDTDDTITDDDVDVEVASANRIADALLLARQGEVLTESDIEPLII
jgi:hypothetical protein